MFSSTTTDSLLDACSPKYRNTLGSHLAAAKAGKGPRPGDSHDWKLWCQFVHKSGQDPLLSRMQSNLWQHSLE